MASASLSLQKAVFAALGADTALTALLGGARIFDDVAPRRDFPYVAFGQTVERDWATGSDEGSEHTMTLHVWSRARGRSEVNAIMAAARTALHDAHLALDGHALVQMRHEVSEARREADGESYHGIVRFRAVTEPSP